MEEGYMVENQGQRGKEPWVDPETSPSLPPLQHSPAQQQLRQKP